MAEVGFEFQILYSFKYTMLYFQNMLACSKYNLIIDGFQHIDAIIFIIITVPSQTILYSYFPLNEKMFNDISFQYYDFSLNFDCSKTISLVLTENRSCSFWNVSILFWFKAFLIFPVLLDLILALWKERLSSSVVTAMIGRLKRYICIWLENVPCSCKLTVTASLVNPSLSVYKVAKCCLFHWAQQCVLRTLSVFSLS